MASTKRAPRVQAAFSLANDASQRSSVRRSEDISGPRYARQRHGDEPETRKEEPPSGGSSTLGSNHLATIAVVRA